MADTPIAVVTGAAQGIGRACAEALSEDGYKVILVDIQDSVHKAAASLGGVGIICDMGDTDAIGAMFDTIEAGHGPVSALALAGNNIRVNAVGPGSIDTEMMAGVNANPEAYRMAMSRTPLGRSGMAREIGDVVAFLCSKKAGYITGETIYVDGGRLGLNYVMP